MTSVTEWMINALKEYEIGNETKKDVSKELDNIEPKEANNPEVDKINDKYEARLDRLKDRLRRAEAALARKEADAEARKREALVSVGAAAVGMFLGRRSMRAASTALSKHRQTTLKKLEVEEAEATVEALQKDIEELEKTLQEETTAIRERWEGALEGFEEFPVKPRRTDVQVDLLALAWVPHWQVTYQDQGGVARTDVVPAL